MVGLSDLRIIEPLDYRYRTYGADFIFLVTGNKAEITLVTLQNSRLFSEGLGLWLVI